jgi:hypothetical protein
MASEFNRAIHAMKAAAKSMSKKMSTCKIMDPAQHVNSKVKALHRTAAQAMASTATYA